MSTEDSETTSKCTSVTQSQDDTASICTTTETRVAQESTEDNDREQINLPVPSDTEVTRANANTKPPTAKKSSPLVEKLKLLECLDALKFDPSIEKSRDQSKTEMSMNVKGASSKSASAMMGLGSSQGNRLKPTASTKSKARVTPDQTFDNAGAWLSSQPAVQKESQKAENNPPGYATVIKQWGKRPLLVESEAPWTRRNKMYLNAIKALEKASVNNSGNTSGGQPQQQQQQRMMMFPPGIYPPGMMPHTTVYSTTSGGPAPTPVVAGISGLPPEMTLQRPLQVALESSYPYQEIVLPVQAPVPTLQPVMYGHLNSQGMWMPLLQQLHQQMHEQMHLQRQQQQLQQQQRQQQQQQQLQLKQQSQSYHNHSNSRNESNYDSDDS